MANPFHAIAPQSAGASTSSSTKPCYDVFINHRGVDVKRTLASTIYNMLDLMGVKAFLDQEELEVGESFPQAIEEAMRSASVHVAIFSPKYAESPWCLEELSLMLQINVTIIPVFYRVQPFDLRYITKGIFADAFRQHKGKRKYNSEEPRYEPGIITKWEQTLCRVSYLSGFVVDDNSDEGKLLREIVDAVFSQRKKVPLKVATFPVGLDEAVQDFESRIGSFISGENGHIVGILGMGGAGKTTLAKELYNRKRSSISRCSFLSDVRDFGSKTTLHKLQNKLLDDLGIQHPEFHDEDEGKEFLARHFTCMDVLIVLDNVDHMEQILALLPPKVGRGSFIIITTREKNVLRSCGISSIYDMKLLDPVKAKQLFCRHAFLQPYSQHGLEYLAEKSDKFQNLTERFVTACNGLPLSLKVLGAMVNGQSEAYWEDQLHKISRLLPEEIVNCLKLSYDALDREVQQMFLDVSCFFIGDQKSLVVQIWYGSGWSGVLGWETLVNKCLIGLDQYDNIEMHDHLRDMGREIARDVSPSRYRLWKEEQIKNQEVLTPIRGIVAVPRRPFCYIDYPLEYNMEDFIKRTDLRALKLLSVIGVNFREEYAASRDLIWLRLRDFRGSSLPSWLSFENLRVLELYDADNLEELWQDNVQPPLQLTQLIIRIAGQPCLRDLPRSIGRLRCLKKINISECHIATLPEEFCQLESLEDLRLAYFPELSSLPVDFGKLINLRSITFREVGLTGLPGSFKQLTALQSLRIERCRSFMFSSKMLDVLEFMTQLEELSFEGCFLLEMPHLTTQVSLRSLNLIKTKLRELPNNIGQLTKLQNLWIGSNNLTKLPESFGALSSLTDLDIAGCKTSKSFYFLSNLRSLTIDFIPVVEIGLGMESPSRCNLKSLKSLRLTYTQVCKISISDDCCPCLEFIYLRRNHNLTEIETLPGNVRSLSVSSCQSLKSMRAIGRLLNLERLEVDDCPDLEVVPYPSYMHSVGHTVTITCCPKLGII